MTGDPTKPARVVARSGQVSGLACFRPFGVALIGGPGNEVRSLAPVPLSEELDPAPSRFVPVPDGIDDERALLAAPTAAALRIWSSLRLELGDAAVHTHGPGSALVGEIARWGGGVPVVEVGEGSPAEPESVSIDDPEQAATRLRELARASPGFAAVDLSGRPEIVDVLLDALPPWGRLLLAARYEKALTVDFYGDVHRKGAVLLSAPYDPVAMIDRSSLFLRRAFRLLADPGRATMVARLLGPSSPA